MATRDVVLTAHEEKFIEGLVTSAVSKTQLVHGAPLTSIDTATLLQKQLERLLQ